MSIEERSKRFTPRVSTAFCMARARPLGPVQKTGKLNRRLCSGEILAAEFLVNLQEVCKPYKSSASRSSKVWNGGQGGQCPLTPATRGLCQYHVDRDEDIGLNYGRVDGAFRSNSAIAFSPKLCLYL